MANTKYYPKKKRTQRKRKMRITRSLSNTLYKFSRSGIKTIIYTTGAGTIGSQGNPSSDSGISLSAVSGDSLTGCYQFGLFHSFSLSQIIDHTDFTNLFDKYKITGIKYNIMYQCNSAQVSGLQVLPIIHYCKDEDDVSTPTQLKDLTSRQNVKKRVFGNTQQISLYFKPKVATMIYQGATSTGYGVGTSWINSTYNTVQHFGFKLWLNNVYMTSGSNTALTIEPVYYLQMKDVQ